MNLHILLPQEYKALVEISKREDDIELQIVGYQNQLKVLKMVIERAKIAAEYLKETKPICGYDNRVSFNEALFEKWSKTKEGKTALETGVLGPRTEETEDLGSFRRASSKAADVPDELNNICLILEKSKCKHTKLTHWKEVHRTDLHFQLRILREKHADLQKKRKEIVDEAKTRDATNGYYIDNQTRRMF